MSLQELITPFPWSHYSKKLMAKIDKPHNVGTFKREDSEKRGMRLIESTAGSIEDGNQVKFYWLVDKEDGTIVDAKFQVFGQSALIGAAEAACDLLVRKNYDQAKRISADLIDKQVRDRSDDPAFPKETYPHLNLVLEAIENGAEQCTDIPLATHYVAPPAPVDIGETVEYPGWKDLTMQKKMAVIEEVLNRDIRPYIALDGGGVEILRIEESQVVISYKGNCTSCFSAVGATLSYIQQVIQSKVHHDLIVVPEM